MFRCVFGRFTFVHLLNLHLPAYPADFSTVAHYHHLLGNSSTVVVWSLLLHADSEGPTLIFIAALKALSFVPSFAPHKMLIYYV
jgi:hypothetical protein